MKSIRKAAWVVVALVLLSPTALASSGLVAEQLFLAGSTRLEGDVAALFFESHDDGFSWSLTADAAELVREHATYQAVDTPVMKTYDYFLATPWETEVTIYGATVLSSSETIPRGAMLVLAQAGRVDASSMGLVEVKATRDPVLVQGNAADAQNEDMGEIAHALEGTFLDAQFSEGTYTLTGDLTLVMYGPAYTLESGGESTAWQTGEFETTRTAAYVEGAQERHTLTLTNAVLQLRAAEPVTLLTTFPTVAFDGTLKAPAAEGALIVAGQPIVPPADGSPLTYTGAAELALAFDGGRVAASMPAMLSTAAAIAPQSPPVLALGAGAFLVLAAVAAGVLLWLRRARADDLELALLAMEERRWEDALPRLARVARRDPDNVALMVDRALCLEQVGRFEDAARSFESALRAAPGLAEAHYYYARTLAKMRQADAARVHLEEALERDPRLHEMMRAEPALRGL